jgi:hypothetical protein
MEAGGEGTPEPQTASPWSARCRTSLILAESTAPAPSALTRRHSSAAASPSPRHAADPLLFWPQEAGAASPDSSPRCASPLRLSPGPAAQAYARRTPAVSASAALEALPAPARALGPSGGGAAAAWRLSSTSQHLQSETHLALQQLTRGAGLGAAQPQQGGAGRRTLERRWTPESSLDGFKAAAAAVDPPAAAAPGPDGGGTAPAHAMLAACSRGRGGAAPGMAQGGAAGGAPFRRRTSLDESCERGLAPGGGSAGGGSASTAWHPLQHGRGDRSVT